MNASYASGRSVGDVPRPITAGVVVGFDQLGHAAALATLVFAGTLQGGIVAATWVFALSSLVPTLLLALDRRLPAPIFAMVQHAPIAVLLPAIAVVGAEALSPAEGVATVVAILAITAAGVGAALVVTAAFDLTRAVRLMPFPVASGFLAATGALLFLSALSSTTSLSLADVPGAVLRGDPTMAVPVLALSIAVALGLATRWSPGLGPALVLVVGLIGTHLGLALAGIDREAAQGLGLLRAVPADQAQAMARVDWIAGVDWSLVSGALPLMAAAVLISLFGCVLNLSGVELIQRRDVPMRRVYLWVGLSNLALSPLGASTNYISLSSTSIGTTLGGQIRTTAFVVCALVGAGLFFVDEIVALLPPFLMAGLLMFIGATIVDRWFLSQRRVNSRADWLVTGLIVLVAITFGIVPAIALGIVAASMIFAVNYARLPVIRSTATLAERRSRVDRGPVHSAYLDRHGGEVAIVTLQGYLFFGSIDQLSSHARALFDGTPKAHTLILDCRRVRQIDAAAAAALQRLSGVARTSGGRIVLAEMQPAVAAAAANAVVTGAGTAIETAQTIDAAMEMAEVELLHRMAVPETDETAVTALAEVTGDADLARRLLSRMDRLDLAEGDRVIEMGSDTQDVFVIDRGRLSVQVPGPGGAPVRIRSMRPGAFVGEIASYAGVPRTADVVAETDAVLYRLRPSLLDEITLTDPTLAAAWHKLIAVGLAEKLHRTTKLLGEQ